MSQKRSDLSARSKKRSRSVEDVDESGESKRRSRKMKPVVPLNTVETVTAALQQAFQECRNPTRALQMKKYMRNQFDYFGIQSPERRRLYPNIYTKMGLGSGSSPSATWAVEKLVQLIHSLWRLPQRDFQHFALDLAEKQCRVLCKDFDTAVSCLRTMIMEKSWWDTVDMIASHLVGYVVEQHSQRGKRLMDMWVDDECMWLRRTAILHQLNYKERCDEARLFNYCLKRAAEEEFFIRKAIGWALRQHARTRPATVKRFVLEYSDELSTLSKREALKHLSSVKC